MHSKDQPIYLPRYLLHLAALLCIIDSCISTPVARRLFTESYFASANAARRSPTYGDANKRSDISELTKSAQTSVTHVAIYSATVKNTL